MGSPMGSQQRTGTDNIQRGDTWLTKHASKHRHSDNIHIFFYQAGISGTQTIWVTHRHVPRHLAIPVDSFLDTRVVQGSLHLWHHTTIFLMPGVRLVGITVIPTHTAHSWMGAHLAPPPPSTKAMALPVSIRARREKSE